MTAWAAGFTGQGITVGVIDSGVDAENIEFAGRFHPLSTDVTTGGRGFDDTDTDGHGTNVAAVIAAARNDRATVGLAYDATILALRADRPGSCTDTSVPEDEQGCRYGDTAIAAGIDRAIAAQARVINISLGGSTPGVALRLAVARAAAAGIIIVVSAGNDGGSTEAGIDPTQPDPFAQGLQQAGVGLVIIAGSHGENDAFAASSNRAGNFASVFLTARGDRVCCDYENGDLRRETRPDGTFVFLISGTSFAAPQISGAAALLAQAFPNLTGRQIVELLLTRAREAGDVGVDATYGRGILDLARAFAPAGSLRVAGSTAVLDPTRPVGGLSGPMGDAGSSTRADALVLDAYDRVYAADLGQMLGNAVRRPQLAPALATGARSFSASAGDAAVMLTTLPSTAAFTDGVGRNPFDDRRARLLAGAVAARIGPRTQLAFALAREATGVLAAGTSSPGGFLVADRADSLRLVGVQPRNAAALARGLGQGWQMVAGVDAGTVSDGRFGRDPRDLLSLDERYRYARTRAALSGAVGPVQVELGASLLDEQRSVLGARFAGVLDGAAGRTLFADASLMWGPASGWWIGADMRRGRTAIARSGFVNGGTIITGAWSVEAGRHGAVVPGDTLALRLAQPLRVDAGGLRLSVPVDYDYATQLAANGERMLTLSPSGREHVAELAWTVPVTGGSLSFNSYWRTAPYHIATAPDDLGLAMRLMLGF